jgi:asparagine synthetase B (glutamine-hydrolysing)
LRKIDGATMHHGLEARAPLLDQQLWEFASALPVGVRLAGGRLKAPLRAIARRPHRFAHCNAKKTRLYDSGAALAGAPVVQPRA